MLRNLATSAIRESRVHIRDSWKCIVNITTSTNRFITYFVHFGYDVMPTRSYPSDRIEEARSESKLAADDSLRARFTRTVYSCRTFPAAPIFLPSSNCNGIRKHLAILFHCTVSFFRNVYRRAKTTTRRRLAYIYSARFSFEL